jgi:hypothetical protein
LAEIVWLSVSARTVEKALVCFYLAFFIMPEFHKLSVHFSCRLAYVSAGAKVDA